MFGFGRPAAEKEVIELFAKPLLELGQSPKDAKVAAAHLVDEILNEFKPRGIDPFKSTQGDDYSTREPFVKPRLAAGLTLADIKKHWNRPLIVSMGEMKLSQLLNFIMVDIARQQGKDERAAGTHYKRTVPRYGDPAKWDPADPYNRELKPEDADIYPEFAGRVDAWRAKTSQAEVDSLIAEHGTLNAVIRTLVAEKKL